MKAIFYVIIIFVFNHGFGQECNVNNSKKYISNTCNMQLFKIPMEYQRTDKSEYIFKGRLLDLFKYNITEKEYEKLYNFTNVSSLFLVSAIAFSIDGDENKVYAYPINSEVFNNEYFEKKYKALDEQTDVPVNIYASIYNSKNIDYPIVIIEKVVFRD